MDYFVYLYISPVRCGYNYLHLTPEETCALSYGVDFTQGFLVVMSNSFVTPSTVAHQAPPCPWDSRGMNTGVDCYFLLQ